VLPAGGGAWDGTVGGMTLFHDAFGLQTETPIPYKSHNLNLFLEKVRAFVNAVENGLPAPISTSQIIYNQAIISGILESGRLGREVEIVISEI